MAPSSSGLGRWPLTSETWVRFPLGSFLLDYNHLRFPTMYQLLDSGGMLRLERFGDKTLSRPSRLAIWNQGCNSRIWQTANAEFDHKFGWKHKDNKDNAWKLKLDAVTSTSFEMLLRFQTNGQIGFFPEHLSYANDLFQTAASIKDCRVLNLFAYTGLASIVCAKAGAAVTHVDISQQANNWAKENFLLNLKDEAAIKIITEDAVKFCQKLISRGEKYNLIICDPPSFSRVSKTKSWDLEVMLVEILKLIKEILSSNGKLFFTTHLHEFGDMVLANLCYDIFPKGCEITHESLFVQEVNSKRKLPSGYLVKVC